jgi:hypothetical protein
VTTPATEPVKDPLALGLGSLATGVGFGGACMTIAQIYLSLNQQRFEIVGYYALTAGLMPRSAWAECAAGIAALHSTTSGSVA